MTAPTTSSATPAPAGGTLKPKTGPVHRTNGAQPAQTFSVIKAPSEGGTKRMLDVIFEQLRYAIQAEWTEGQAAVVGILEDFEDVELTPPQRLTDDEEKDDDLILEMWKEDVKQHIAERRALERAKRKLYSHLWKIMSKVMQNKVTGQVDFAAKNKAGDVVWLVNLIRTLITEFDHSVPPVMSAADAMSKILNYEQTDKMENADYLKGLLALVKVFEQHCGVYGVYSKELIEIYSETEAARDENGAPFSDEVKMQVRKEMIRKSRDKAIAIQLLRGACKKRYTYLRKNLAVDYGLKVDKYPNTIDEAINALNVQETNLPAHLQKTKTGFVLVQDGTDLTAPGRNGKMFAQIQCHKCKKNGHYASQCPDADAEPKDSQVSTHVVLHQSHLVSDGKPLNQIQLTISPGTLDASLILLDSQSTVHVFNNKTLLTDIKRHPEGRTLRVFTNGGYLDSVMVGMFGNINVWYNPKSIANILSLALIVDSYRVTFDSARERAFLLWWDNSSYIRFSESNLLFAYHTKKDSLCCVNDDVLNHTLVQTVHQNERMYRRREIESARVAQDVSTLLFHPAQSRFEKIIAGNFVSNLPITLADMRRTEKIYGPSVPSIKGRTTRQQPMTVLELHTPGGDPVRSL